VASLTMAICAAFRADWPVWLLDGVLFVAGFFRSLQFTAYNTIAYGDIPRPRMSAATTLYSTVQQLSLTMGVVAGAASLEISSWLSGHTAPAQGDYAAAFLVVSAVALVASPLCARLPADAGEQLSGHHERV
jgi:hypothetical protein